MPLTRTLPLPQLLLPGSRRQLTGVAAAAAAAAAAATSHPPRHIGPWRPASVLDEWVAREARPISLRQLMVFGRSLTEARLISSANYVRTELPTRLAHRIRDMQRLPYAVVTNPHVGDVYDLYYDAFDTFRRIREIESLEDNDRFCKTIVRMLKSHLTVIPKLALGVLECGGRTDPTELDRFMNTILKSRISRRVIAEQHLTLSETFNSFGSRSGPALAATGRGACDLVGQVFIRCVARDVIERVAVAVRDLARSTYGPDVALPEVRIDGHLDAGFPYIVSHLEYIVGELLRNSVRALVERQQQQRRMLGAREGVYPSPPLPPPPIEVTICATAQHVIIRISDRGGGIPREVLPYVWSFTKGPESETLRRNLSRVPKMAATLQEVHIPDPEGVANSPAAAARESDGAATATATTAAAADAAAAVASTVPGYRGSLSRLTSRPPDLRLGMSLPMSRVFAEYWAGSLEIHSLEGYGVDAFLQISRLGNKNEQLSTRAMMDAV